ncbi:MAG: hypothetical protein JW822_07200 [Spirochaetales bacterium]|nr:hypothetical protein [Spirochaetales bacterium]
MKYKLETIPVWDAFKENGECPLCTLEEKNEKNYIRFFLGDSVMDPDTRVQVNKTGFCAQHAALLFSGGHKQGLGLMMHTFLLETIPQVEVYAKALSNKAQDLTKKNVLTAVIAKDRTLNTAIDNLAKYAEQNTRACIFCHRLEQTLLRYTFTIIYLWKKDPEFKKTLSTSKGFCLKHLPMVLRMAKTELSGAQSGMFFKMLIPLEVQSLKRLEQEILWFTQKFEYANRDKPWKTSKDALQRTLQKLTGGVYSE